MTRAALIAAVLGCGCGLPDGEYFGDVPSLDGRDLTVLRWCNSGEPESLDPAFATTTTSLKLVYLLFDGLYTYDVNGLPEPSVATSMDQSDDVRRFTFHLRTDARWSSGRGVTAQDFAYQIERVLHPTTASPNGDSLFPIKNAEAYLGDTVRVVLADTAGLAAGAEVEITGVGGKTVEELTKAGTPVPQTNLRKSTHALALRDLGASESKAYARVPAGTGVRIIEISGRPAAMPSPAPDAPAWAYVFWASGDGVYGWVPLTDLDVSPSAAVVFSVRPVAKRMIYGLDATPEELAADDKVERASVDVRGDQLLLLPELLGIRVPDPYTLVLETKSPTPFLLSVATQRPMRATPREAIARSPKRWAEPGPFVGSGPMILTAWKERDRVELARSETYWHKDLVKLTRIIAYSIADQAAITNYYYTGGCDATTSNPVPATYMPVMNGEKRNHVPYKDFLVVPWNAVYYPIINAQKFPNRHLRRALSFAIDRKPVVDILKGGQIPSAQLTPGRLISDLSDDELALCGVTRDHPGVAMIMITGQLCYVPPPGLDYDPVQAKAEIALARKEMGASFPASITYRYNIGSEAHKLIGELLQADWQRELGLNVKLESQEWKTMVSDATAGNFETMRFGAVGNVPDTESEFLPGFKCKSPDNRSHWCNQDFERAMQAAEVISDRKQRLVKVYEAEKIVVDDAAIIPLYTYTQQFLIRPYVRDMPVNLIDFGPMERSWLDPDWRQHQRVASP